MSTRLLCAVFALLAPATALAQQSPAATDIYLVALDSGAPKNLNYTCNRLDKGLTSLLVDLSSTPGSEPGKTLLDETLIVATSDRSSPLRLRRHLSRRRLHHRA